MAAFLNAGIRGGWDNIKKMGKVIFADLEIFIYFVLPKF